MSIQECWRRFAESSILKASSHPISKQEISPDNSFIIRYVAYHHYRSLGWVVKDGLKYGTDFLLYKKGMVFGHSQFGVQVIACKSRAEATSNPGLPKPAGILHPNSSTSRVSPTPGLFVMHSVHSWQWLLALNRVISQVQKTVILCYVIVPHHITKNDLMSPQKALPMYAIVEVGIKRFVPERNRE
ncbi:hypothetical protein FBU30_003987 [Linnemannia zychae]|nr:hypothetical protein FBU30_003987 [Linnemannia zychae]